MAQTTIPVYLTGKIGSIVYTPNRQGTAVRQLVTPKNPQTAGQQTERARFTAAAKAWQGLSAAAQKTWVTLAATFSNNISAFNAFVKVNIVSQISVLNRGLAGDFLADAGSKTLNSCPPPSANKTPQSISVK